MCNAARPDNAPLENTHRLFFNAGYQKTIPRYNGVAIPPCTNGCTRPLLGPPRIVYFFPHPLADANRILLQAAPSARCRAFGIGLVFRLFYHAAMKISSFILFAIFLSQCCPKTNEEKNRQLEMLFADDTYQLTGV